MGARHENHVDEEGRVTIPEPIRRSLNIESGESVTVKRDDGQIVIEPQIARTAAVTTIETPIFDGNDEAEF